MSCPSHDIKFEQTELSDTWLITHENGLGYPVAECYTIDSQGTQNKITPNEVKMCSSTQIQITFSSPQIGYAIIF